MTHERSDGRARIDRRAVLQGLAGVGVTGLAAGCGAAAGPNASDAIVGDIGEIRRGKDGRFSVRVDGLRIYGVDLGAANAPGDAAIILIHGAGANHRDWTYAVAGALAERHRVIALDRPGFGRSDRPETGAGRPQTQAALLARAVDAIGVGRFVLVGHSWGGAVAMAWALRRPARTAGIVSVAGATMPWDFGETLDYLGGGLNTLGAFIFDEGSTAEIALERVFRPQTPPADYAQHMGYAGGLDAVPLWETVDDLLTLNGALDQMRAEYGRITAPVSILHGDRDKIVPIDVHAYPLMQAVRLPELVVFDGVGHMLHHARPARVAGIVERHVLADRRRAL